MATCPERGSHSILLQISQQLPMGGVPEKTLSKNAHPPSGALRIRPARCQEKRRAIKKASGPFPAWYVQMLRAQSEILTHSLQ